MDINIGRKRAGPAREAEREAERDRTPDERKSERHEAAVKAASRHVVGMKGVGDAALGPHQEAFGSKVMSLSSPRADQVRTELAESVERYRRAERDPTLIAHERDAMLNAAGLGMARQMARLRYLGVEFDLGSTMMDRMHAGMADRLASRDLKPDELRSMVFTLAMTGGSLREVTRHLPRGHEDAAHVLSLCVGSVLARQQEDMARLEEPARLALARFAVEHNVMGHTYARVLADAAPSPYNPVMWAEPLVHSANEQIKEARESIRLMRGLRTGAPDERAEAERSIAAEEQRTENAYAKLANLVNSVSSEDAAEMVEMLRNHGGDELVEEVARLRGAHRIEDDLASVPSLGAPTKEERTELVARMAAHTLGGSYNIDRDGHGAIDQRLLAVDLADRYAAMMDRKNEADRLLAEKQAVLKPLLERRQQIDAEIQKEDPAVVDAKGKLELAAARERIAADVAERRLKLAGKLPGFLKGIVSKPALERLHGTQKEVQRWTKEVETRTLDAWNTRGGSELGRLNDRIVALKAEAKSLQDLSDARAKDAIELRVSPAAVASLNMSGKAREALVASLHSAVSILHQNGGMMGEAMSERVAEIRQNVIEAMRDPTRSVTRLANKFRVLDGEIRRMTGVDLSEVVHIAQSWKMARYIDDLPEDQYGPMAVRHWATYGNTLRPESDWKGAGSQG